MIAACRPARPGAYPADVDSEPITPSPRHAIDRVVFSQRWAQLTFLHWAVDPRRLHRHMPPGVVPDTIGGRSYVGLVPFLMRDVGVAGSRPIPYFGAFCETNVRLYSVDGRGRRGVVFVSLDASRLVPVLVARYGPGLPYLWSRMAYRRVGDRVAYACHRRWPGPRGTASHISVDVGAPVTAGPLEHFLTARWGLHGTDRRGRTAFWPNAHPQWPLRAAMVHRIDDGLLGAAGFGDLAARPPDSVLFSPGVTVAFGPRRPLR